APRGADEAVTSLFRAHYAGLVRLAVLLVGDDAGAEDVVQDAFARLHRRWARLRDEEAAYGYLRASVVNGSRSRLRRLRVARRHHEPPATDAPSPEADAILREEHAEVRRALDLLPRRQREVLVLRFYANLAEADIADTLGISRGAVKSHAFRGIAALTRTLESR
ncbi:MAG TPA: SigE family RNA polymerase sigma factor, partial [Frankiaceae bacterium]|nr:SigE family RNA polymerase sigma factor [Frankiaceae bacterium]